MKLLKIIYKKIELFFLLQKILNSNKKTIYLFGCPVHVNLGDQAQKLCILKWLNNNYPDYRVIQLNFLISTDYVLNKISQKISTDDLIFGHSGYFFYDKHNELPIYIKLAKLFKSNPIYILPQTVNLHSDSIKSNVKEAFEGNPNITLVCRDKTSLANAQELLPNTKLLLYPDVVTTLIGTKNYNFDRDGVILCVRNDEEAHYSKTELGRLFNKFKDLNLDVKETDTSLSISYRRFNLKSEYYIFKKIKDFSKAKVVITDRYHGTIFSLIANTPVVVISSSDHKLKSGVKWFPESFKTHVSFAEDLDEAFSKANAILNNPPKNRLTEYFNKKYFSVLKSDLD